MATSNSSNINIKMSAVIVGVALFLLGLLGWSLSAHYENMIDQIKTNWVKIDKLEKVLCADHPERCPDL